MRQVWGELGCCGVVGSGVVDGSELQEYFADGGAGVQLLALWFLFALVALVCDGSGCVGGWLFGWHPVVPVTLQVSDGFSRSRSFGLRGLLGL